MLPAALGATAVLLRQAPVLAAARAAAALAPVVAAAMAPAAAAAVALAVAAEAPVAEVVAVANNHCQPASLDMKRGSC
jgi:hypothetical protein